MANSSSHPNSASLKIVIYTLYWENYGAHDWYGEGECPQHWKAKSGSTYMTDVSVAAAVTGEVPAIVKNLMAKYEHYNDYSEEYVIDWVIAGANEIHNHYESWEEPYIRHI